MLLGGNQSDKKQPTVQPDEQATQIMEMCVSLIGDDRYEEAWILLSTFTVNESNNNNSVVLHFNRALCLIRASNDYVAALSLLEKAWNMFSPLAGGIHTPETPELQTMRKNQNERSTYLHPVSYKYAELFPELFRDTILRLLVDCHTALGNDNEVIRLATPIQHKGYRNITEALNKIKTKTKSL